MYGSDTLKALMMTLHVDSLFWSSGKEKTTKENNSGIASDSDIYSKCGK